MKVDKAKFDSLLQRSLQQKPEKTQAIKGTSQQPKPIIPKPTPGR